MVVETETHSSFLDSVTVTEDGSWTVEIRMKQQVISFKMDTGAEVTAIGKETYQLLGEPKLYKPAKILYGPAHQTLDVLGQFSGWLKYGKRSTRVNIYVVQGLKTNLLGLQAMTALQLTHRVHATYRHWRTRCCEAIPTSLQRPREHRGRIPNQTQRKCNSVLIVCAS